MIYIDVNYQNLGYGRKLNFYRKIGYKDCSGFIIDIKGYEQPMEMFMVKAI